MERNKSKFTNETTNNMGDSKFTEFFNFCTFVLAYEGENDNAATDNSPLLFFKKDVSESSTEGQANVDSDSNGEEKRSQSRDESKGCVDNETSDDSDDSTSTSSSEDERQMVYTSDDESWNLVTCYCKRPFAGRPMIECSKCLTWIHLSCANIKKNNVPKVFICQQCKEDAVRRSKRRKYN